jgi:hypothetical protein
MASGPTLGGALRAGASDLFFNSWRIVPANLVFGVGLVAVAWIWFAAGVLAAALASVPLALPLAGLFRLGAMATRGRDVNLSDALDPARRDAPRILAAGLGFAAGTLVLGANVVIGLLGASVAGWIIATAAAWGLLAVIAFGFAFWPLAVDPDRADASWRARARLAGLLVLAHPSRMALLAFLLGVVLAASTVAFAALVTVSVGFCALVACRYVLPAADRLETRLVAAGRGVATRAP